MADNQMTHVEADRRQGKVIARYLCHRYNNTENNPGRPGSYNFRFLPDKQFATGGTRSEADRQNMVRKHSAVISSLELLQGDEIKYLDSPIQPSASTSTDAPTKPQDLRTLRDIILDLTFPLVPKKNQKITKLFHSVDWARSGRDAGKVVYFTAYKDRAEIAEKLIHILPTFIAWSENKPELQDKWFHPQLDGQDVDFI